MNTIKKITLVQFRNYPSAVFHFTAPVTCITGANGSGKTNLLDAVYYLCYTKSYFTAYQQNNVQHDMDGFMVEGVFEQGDKTDVVRCKWKAGKKEVSSNGVLYEQVTDHIGRYASVMIAPDDIALINEGSDLRRKWVDSILSQTDRAYFEKLMRYQRVLLQRNAWLKMQVNNTLAATAELDYYNEQLSIDGTYLYEKRTAFTAQFLPLLNNFYHQLSGGKEEIQAIYESDLQKKSLSEWLADSLQYDMRMQRTLRGTHKDDWVFLLNNIAIKTFGSQGQKKSFLFSLKLAQYAYISDVTGHLPVLLLDDIFEKLDQERIEALLKIIKGEGFGQVLLTDTHAERVQIAFGEGAEIGFIAL